MKDDTISRAAALDAMRKAKDKSELHRMLVQLPSAQPVNIAKLQPNCNQVATDYISRQAAIDVLATMQGLCTSKTALVQNSKIWQQIKDLPSADAQPIQHGRWIKTRMPVTGAIEIKCSECNQKYYTAFQLMWNYCPSCGARMDGEQYDIG